MQQITRKKQTELIKWCQSLQLNYYKKIGVDLDLDIDSISLTVFYDGNYSDCDSVTMYFNSKLFLQKESIYISEFKIKVMELIEFALKYPKKAYE